jgi:DNA polymerase I-like protein with 3'-5' exonuclease and polymerase domains
MGNIPQENLSVEALKMVKKRKGAPKEKKDRTLRGLFRALLSAIDIEKLKKPWMAKKSFQNLTTPEDLRAYVDGILNDRSSWKQPYFNDEHTCPVVAVDTETYGLDTRVMVSFELVRDYATGREICIPIYELNVEIAGVVLSADGIKGVYIPLFHEDGKNVPIEVVRAELQRLFDVSHLVFYNAKFDREILRQTVGITFRGYPHYEDIQVLHYSNDPKAKLDDDTFTGGGEGLKGLSRDFLGIDQIDLEEIGKVQAELELSPEEQEAIRLRPNWIKLSARQQYFCDCCAFVSSGPVCATCGIKPSPTKGCKTCKRPFDELPLGCDLCRKPIRKIACETCGDAAINMRVQIVPTPTGEITERKFECAKPDCSTKVTYKKSGLKMQYVPFMWIPTELAVWYAAADGICTWMLWDHKPRKAKPEDAEPDILHVEAQKRKVVHKIDGQLIDTLTWMERQRQHIDVARHERLMKWNERNKAEMLENIRQIANRHGWEESSDDDGKVFEDTRFNPNSKNDMPRLLFDIKKFTPSKITAEGHRSVDADVLIDLLKAHPHDEFLRALSAYKEYVALHPESLSWDKRDGTARIYLKQSTVAGGRLAAAGGDFSKDGGVSINIQAVKKVEGNWWVKGDVLEPDLIAFNDVEPREESELDPSCFIEAKKDEVLSEDGKVLELSDPIYADSAAKMGFNLRNGKWTKKAPGIIRNHIANYLGYAVCLVPGCTSCREKHGILIKKTKIDANQIMNLRALFVAQDDTWTYLCTDYSNIEVRGAANITGETELQKIFLEGDGDHHALTASKVFAEEWNDPNTSKARRKQLRGIAKIINFALQYGGSEFTIYENLKETIPDITLEKAKEMVDTYWKGVPKFREWCDEKQKVAREEMVCYTNTGRIIKFRSAMKALGLYEPSPEQKSLMFDYYRLRKKYRECDARAKVSKSEEDKAQALTFKGHMDRLWNDPDTGVRNAIDFNKFMSKIERVAVNAPVQGLAGDFMRMSLNRIRLYCTEIDPLIQAVLRLHNSVHDEIDYTVKNKYLPYVVPRLTRLMKLRKLHAAQKWPVPIESDTEYGPSWDVKYHLTGDDGHKPSGWTDTKGMEEYLPAGFTLEVVDKVVRAIASGDQARFDKAYAWIKGIVHERAMEAAEHAFWENIKDKKPLTDVAAIRKQLIAALQLHEYWSIDAIDDGEELPETFEEFEERCGLTVADRGFMPEGGWLFTVPQDRVKRKVVPVLGAAPKVVPPPDADVETVEAVADLHASCDYWEDFDTRNDADLFNEDGTRNYGELKEELADVIAAGVHTMVDTVFKSQKTMEDRLDKLAEKIGAGDSPKSVEADELFHETPKRKTQVVETIPAPVSAQSGVPALRDDLNPEELPELKAHLCPGMGYHTVKFTFKGLPSTFHKCFRADIPAHMLKGA